jgi:transketolase
VRNIFMEELTAAAAAGKPIMLIVGDLGWGVVEEFADRFPNNFINAGVAEQNMMGMAAGLASEGYHVFCYSIANFPTFRCAEQIRNDVDYHHLPVTVVSVGGGVAYGSLGYSHHAVQDYALMRTMPNMLIAAPCDDMEARACVRYLLNNPQPSYLRLGRGGEKQYRSDIPEISPGKWSFLRYVDGDAKARSYVSTGTSNLPMNEPGSYFTLPLWGMKYKNMQITESRDFDQVTTFEDHLKDGGFGSWMLESLHTWDVTVGITGFDPRICGMVGDSKYLHEQGMI